MKNKYQPSWMFLVNRLEASWKGSFAYGHFVILQARQQASDEGPIEYLDIQYVTPEDEETKLRLPKSFYPRDTKEIGPSEVYSGLKRLFSLPYGEVPHKSVEASMYSVPPSLRTTIEALANGESS